MGMELKLNHKGFIVDLKSLAIRIYGSHRLYIVEARNMRLTYTCFVLLVYFLVPRMLQIGSGF